MVQILNRECSQKIDRAELSRCVQRIDLMLPAYRYGLYDATKPVRLRRGVIATAPSLRRPVLEHSMIDSDVRSGTHVNNGGVSL
jgi:hypothetical protein